MIKRIFIFFVGIFVFCSAYSSVNNTWIKTGNLNIPRSSGATFTVLPNGKALVVGGQTRSNNFITTASAELYDPATGKWTLTGSLKVARFDHTATLLPNGKVLVVGGQSGDTTASRLSSAELYDPISGTWNMAESLNKTRACHSATLLKNGLILVSGGIDNKDETLSSAELYNPVTKVWQMTGSMNRAHALHAAVLLPNGQVLVAGGRDITTNAELYNPITGAWSTTGSMCVPRTFIENSPVLLPNGKVLIAGGQTWSPSDSTTSELYDYTTGTWTRTGSMSIDRFHPLIALLPNGHVLAAGGYYLWNGNAPHTSAELYDPTTGTWSLTDSLNIGRVRSFGGVLPNGVALIAGGYRNYPDMNSIEDSVELYNHGIEVSSLIDSSSHPQPPIETSCNCICSYYDNFWSGKHIESLGEIPDADICNKLCLSAYYGKMEGCFEKALKN